MDTRLLMARLRAAHPDAACALVHRTPFELLVATILSAQCTDARVNQVTPDLFARYPDPAAMSRARPHDLEKVIRSTGFYRNKTKAIRGASQRIVEEFGGDVPRTMDQLLTLPGVARKTASVVLGVAYGVAEGIVVDTHVARISRRLGLTRGKNAEKVEIDLMRLIPREDWIDFAHLLIFHGRRICQARKPRCPECPVYDLCPSAVYFLSGRVPPWDRAGVVPPVKPPVVRKTKVAAKRTVREPLRAAAIKGKRKPVVPARRKRAR